MKNIRGAEGGFYNAPKSTIVIPQLQILDFNIFSDETELYISVV